jgi:hypothetical protein
MLFRNNSLTKYNDPNVFQHVEQRVLNTLATGSKWNESVLKQQFEAQGIEFPKLSPVPAGVESVTNNTESTEVIEEIDLNDIGEQEVADI